MDQTQRRSPAQRFKAGFGLNMIVMAVSFALYYLGFFGGVEGPLAMPNIGRALADIGFTVVSFQAMLVVLFVIALTWNWVLNLIAHLTGQRLTCTKGSPQEGFCAELVRRDRDPFRPGMDLHLPPWPLPEGCQFPPDPQGQDSQLAPDGEPGRRPDVPLRLTADGID